MHTYILDCVGSHSFEIFRDLSRKYGEVFSISMGMKRIVVVNSIASAKEALVTKGTDFIGRESRDLVTTEGNLSNLSDSNY